MVGESGETRALQLGVYGSCLDHVLWSVRDAIGKCRRTVAERYFNRRHGYFGSFFHQSAASPLSKFIAI